MSQLFFSVSTVAQNDVKHNKRRKRIGLQRYIFPRYKGHDTRATMRYMIIYVTLLCVTKLVTNNLDYFQIIYFHNNKFDIVITQHQIALQGLKCRAWVRNIKDSALKNLLMWHILSHCDKYCNILFNINIGIAGKTIAVH